MWATCSIPHNMTFTDQQLAQREAEAKATTATAATVAAVAPPCHVTHVAAPSLGVQEPDKDAIDDNLDYEEGLGESIGH